MAKHTIGLSTRLRRAIEGLPDGTSVTFPVERIRTWVADSKGDVEPDRTVREVAELFGRSPVTVRAWIRAGRLKAYRFRGREYRVSSDALETFIERERSRLTDIGEPDGT